MDRATETTADAVDLPAASLAVVAVTRRAVGAGGGVRTVSCRRVTLTPTSTLPDAGSTADVVVVAFHPLLTAAERAAITGPGDAAHRGPWLVGSLVALAAAVVGGAALADAGFVSGWALFAFLVLLMIVFPVLVVGTSGRRVRRAWRSWSADVLAAHRRLYPADPDGARREVTEPVSATWGGPEGLRARRCWGGLVIVGTLPRPVSGTNPAPAANRGPLPDSAVWRTPTALAGEQMRVEEYEATARRFVTLADDLRTGRVANESPEHLRGVRELSELTRRTGESGRFRVDWAPVLQP